MDQALIIDNGLLMRPMGKFESNMSNYKVEAFFDMTNSDNPAIRIELMDYGNVSYRLDNLKAAYCTNPLVRQVVRAVEDNILAMLDANIELSLAEQAFYEKWILSR